MIRVVAWRAVRQGERGLWTCHDSESWKASHLIKHDIPVFLNQILTDRSPGGKVRRGPAGRAAKGWRAMYARLTAAANSSRIRSLSKHCRADPFPSDHRPKKRDPFLQTALSVNQAQMKSPTPNNLNGPCLFLGTALSAPSHRLAPRSARLRFWSPHQYREANLRASSQSTAS